MHRITQTNRMFTHSETPIQIAQVNSALFSRNDKYKISMYPGHTDKVSKSLLRALKLHKVPQFTAMKQEVANEMAKLAKDMKIPRFTDIQGIPNNDTIPPESLRSSKYCNFQQLSRDKIPLFYASNLPEKEKYEAWYMTQFSETLVRSAGAMTTNQKIEMIFSFVQELEYSLGDFNKTAYQTLIEGKGTCSNKINLFKAMLNSIGIPCLPIIYEVKAPDYLGEALKVPQLSFWIKEKSVHVAAIVHNGKEWIAMDPSDNSALTTGAFISTVLPVYFDSTLDNHEHGRYLLYLDPIYVNKAEVLTQNLDDYLSKGPLSQQSDLANKEMLVHIALISLYVEYHIYQNGKNAHNEPKKVPELPEERWEAFLIWLNDSNNQECSTPHKKRVEIFEKYSQFLWDMMFQDTKLGEQFQKIAIQMESFPKEYFLHKKFKFLNELREKYGDFYLNPQYYLQAKSFSCLSKEEQLLLTRFKSNL